MFCTFSPDDLSNDNVPIELRHRSHRGELRHAISDVLPDSPSRRRSQTMANAKEHAYSRLQEELNKAQEVINTFQAAMWLALLIDCLFHQKDVLG